MTVERAKMLIRRCESELRALVAKAADDGDYAAVIEITAWAKQLAELATQGSAILSIVNPAQSRVAGRKSTKRSLYPKFGRSSNELVKIGWSKKAKREYRHRVSKTIVDLLVKSLSKVGKGGQMFGIADCLPLIDPQAQSEVPEYQIYVAVAWLRAGDLIEQYGRKGYSIPKPDNLSAAADSAWRKLPTI